MEDLIQEHKPTDFCNCCGVRQDDEAAYGENTVWGVDGPQCAIHESININVCIDMYLKDEKAGNVQAFNRPRWKRLLEEHKMWRTICWRCSHLLGTTKIPTSIFSLPKIKMC